MKLLNTLKNNWIKYSIFILGLIIFGSFISCEPKTKSLLHNGETVTAAELKIELETLLAIAKTRQDDLVKQNQLRNLILNNVLIIAQTGTFNPIGILTGLFAFYGLGSAANSTKNAVKKKLKNGSS